MVYKILDKGDYPEHLHVVFCPNIYIYIYLFIFYRIILNLFCVSGSCYKVHQTSETNVTAVCRCIVS